MSNKKQKRRQRGPYTLRVRADRWEQAHRRITLAALHFHKTVGPARTTMDAIAKRAGVQRATVYNHFPTELELFDACSSHWFVENPPPDPADWQKVDDPAERTEKALKEMYDYFDRGKEMLGKVLRDAPVVPAMGSIRDQKWTPMLEGMVEILANGWTGSQSRIRASLRVALDFFTWESLADSGLSDEAAAMLAAGWIRSSV